MMERAITSHDRTARAQTEGSQTAGTLNEFQIIDLNGKTNEIHIIPVNGTAKVELNDGLLIYDIKYDRNVNQMQSQLGAGINQLSQIQSNNFVQLSSFMPQVQALRGTLLASRSMFGMNLNIKNLSL
ncbi:MAG: hypothetical protein LBL45_04470 [Treponema sp.]|jgi:hypothetical protein|nr:hypothetical protein [Treponema sp.]